MALGTFTNGKFPHLCHFLPFLQKTVLSPYILVKTIIFGVFVSHFMNCIEKMVCLQELRCDPSTAYLYKNMFAQVCYLSSFNKFDRRVNIPLDGSLCYQMGQYITRWVSILLDGSVYY